tara:strand:+ start:147 stop:587 length:441 start_codon:yes stop_codon:yes gene_type:complete
MLIICTECKTEISDKAKKCPKCGAPVPSWFDKLPESYQSVFGYFIFGVILFGLIWNFFLKSEIEVSDETMHYNIISDRSISFTAKNSGRKHTYNYYVNAGDEILDRVFSPKYCEGTFVMEKNEERQIKAKCPDLNFTFTKYSIVVE